MLCVVNYITIFSNFATNGIMPLVYVITVNAMFIPPFLTYVMEPFFFFLRFIIHVITGFKYVYMHISVFIMLQKPILNKIMVP